MAPTVNNIFLLNLVLASTSLAQAPPVSQQACPGTFKQFEPTFVASGFQAYVIAKDLISPRGIIFDNDDNLLVLEKNVGVTALKLKQEGNCVTVATRTPLLKDATLNHGITLSNDGNKIFASSKTTVYSWEYSAKDSKTSGQPVTWVTGMNQTGHQSRTLLMSKKAPGILLVSRGSGPNIDVLARDIKTGVSQIRSFDTSTPKQYDYKDGKVIAWGLRNSVGLGENPADGGIWSNENASDNMQRNGTDIHETSPGEEINYHGTLTGKSDLHGKNYGYPECATAWDVESLPNNSKLKVGMQFAYNETKPGIDDDVCARDYIPPRIALPSHWAPLDIAFNAQGTVAYMTSHGSWNKQGGDGYRLFAITFKNGQPTHPSTSKTAHIPIVMLDNMRSCGKGNTCFRPVGAAFDSKGRLFISSDSSGEIYAISRADGRPVGSATAEEIEALERTEPKRAGKGMLAPPKSPKMMI